MKLGNKNYAFRGRYKKLKEVLATKEDLAKILTLEEFDHFRRETAQEFYNLRESIQALTISVDRLANFTLFKR